MVPAVLTVAARVGINKEVVMPGNTQGIVLTLHSGIIPGTIWDAGN